MNAPKILVVKSPRSDPITDKPVNFPSFPVGRLHLELLEIKKKLKKHIPTISVRKSAPQTADSDSDSDDSVETNEDGDDVMNNFKAGESKEQLPSLNPKSSSTATSGAAPQASTAVAGGGGEKEDFSDFGGSEIAAFDDDGDGEGEASNEISPEEKEKLEQEEKEELIVKFRTLKKAYPNNEDLKLLSYTEHDDLNEMRKMYKRTIAEIAFDRKISNYRSYLAVSFMVIEYGFRYLGMNMEGFAKHQAKSIDDYNSLLVELGEKTQGSWMDNFPVEVRLLGLVVFQAVVFWFAKNKNIDISNIMNVISGMVPKQEPVPSGVELPSEAPAPAKKMKGPSIKPK